ncbi:aminomuconate-semialdehyde/2-hydroxymuconate-6-semialdehyde dehydrogenase [Aquimarina sp. EL_43]|uniref:aldehyde dehydrogenase n=1 Tax=unclassified Aquimarina TaxID=2627091 RepID=UPI0018C9DBCF|nr:MULTISPECIES: aldehyde dehydrogenase [unclassified Aquimarina]MBG6128568.1 aminomuconate-semialdehyde/2-hydroxymuconate-6-semialdehyde dehydrogenase [Aquimarina sp. EL_35]MBG6149631.1 aminomuconate-semialdehyde/2-hydroxymuconate-6-semialdehyde dehydrogenase [Aquimarina sp. EL_32]MBG6167684.1 aminomuconate-semialdehyde/2-hydroxymuconate-6-semialdehyde dehydrogenase [Aquimarina sp. EL_43]
MKKIKNYINGEFKAPVQDEWIDNYNPSTGAIYSLIPNSSTADVQIAYDAAAQAFPSWSETPLQQRSEILAKIASLIIENLDQLAQAETIDNGKPLSLSTSVDIPRASSNFQFFANAITQFASEAHESTGLNAINFTLRQSIGVVGCISPWNLPLYLFTWKIAPALAAGNTVVAKPSEITPMTAYLLGDICTKAGLPKGVLNIVHGLGNTTGQAIIEHPNIKAISFTGGTATGAHIAKTAAPMFKKLSLELGGKNPNLIFADCDYDKMLNTTLRSSFANQGQICLCGSRIFIERTIYDKFKTDFIAKTKALKVGAPLDPETNLGALVSKSHLEKVKSYIGIAEEEGGTILCGGNYVTVNGYEKGYYLQPTIIEINTTDCRLAQEEIFGPVVTIMPFDNDDDALTMANNVRYGLSCTIWTNNLNRSMYLAKHIQAGIVWVNTWMMRDLRTPFGGTKDSGVGREGGFEALRFFTEPKNVCIQY